MECNTSVTIAAPTSKMSHLSWFRNNLLPFLFFFIGIMLFCSPFHIRSFNLITLPFLLLFFHSFLLVSSINRRMKRSTVFLFHFKHSWINSLTW